MNHNTETVDLGFCETVCEMTSEQSLDSDVTLPDYCPEIRRILKCTVDTNILSVQASDMRITADANACVRLLYLGEDGRISAYEQAYPIRKQTECGTLDSECAVNVKAVTDYVNCRAVNPRRVDIRAMLSFVFKAMKKREENILCGADGAGIQTLCTSHKAVSLCGVCERQFSLSEVTELSEGTGAIAHIVNIGAYAVCNDIKIINNKALIKGDCCVKIHYLSESGSSIESLEHIMPISQIVELDGINENCMTALRMNVVSCEGLPKVDSSGEMRLINIGVQISAMLTAFNEKEIKLISDAYSTKYRSENAQKSIELFSIGESFDTSFTNKVVLESIGVSVDCVLSVWCSELKFNTTAKDDKCTISGTYKATVVYKDSDGGIGIIQKPVDFDYTLKLREKTDRLSFFGGVQLGNCSCSITGNSRLEIKTELFASGIVLSGQVKKYISSINISDDSELKERACALTIYYSEKNESVWSIAKKYNTTAEAIMSENELDSEVTRCASMLMIPSV